MLRWDSERNELQPCDLPPWWSNKAGLGCAEQLIEFAKKNAGTATTDIELVEPNMRASIMQLKNDIFNVEGEEQADRPSHSPIPLAEKERIRRARAAVNPFEQIGRSVFINRAAVKLASIDAALDFILSERNPQRHDGENSLTFADLCGGPGGFTEYIIWRLSGLARGDSPVSSPNNQGRFDHVRGFGLTLKGRHDDFQPSHWWSLQKLKGELPFQAIYGPHADSDGDITVEENRRVFIETVRAAAPNGCGLVLGDGGFDMTGREQKQEMLISKLLAYEFACALQLLAPGGNFLCKLFDVATPVTATLLYVLSAFFEKMTIVKPVTSRPANGERYVVCTNFLAPDVSVVDEMVSLLTRAANAIDSDADDGSTSGFGAVLPAACLPADFIVFLRNLNNEIATRQQAALTELLAEARDPTRLIGGPAGMTPAAALKIANECSRLWHLPPVAQTSPAGSNTANGSAGSYTRPSGLANGGQTPRSNGMFDSAASVTDWRAQKTTAKPTPPPAVVQPSTWQRPSGLASNGKTMPFYNNNNHSNNGGGFFSKSTPPNGHSSWKPRGLADSVSNWRQSPAQ